LRNKVRPVRWAQLGRLVLPAHREFRVPLVQWARLAQQGQPEQLERPAHKER